MHDFNFRAHVIVNHTQKKKSFLLHKCTYLSMLYVILCKQCVCRCRQSRCYLSRQWKKCASQLKTTSILHLLNIYITYYVFAMDFMVMDNNNKSTVCMRSINCEDVFVEEGHQPLCHHNEQRTTSHMWILSTVNDAYKDVKLYVQSAFTLWFHRDRKYKNCLFGQVVFVFYSIHKWILYFVRRRYEHNIYR